MKEALTLLLNSSLHTYNNLTSRATHFVSSSNIHIFGFTINLIYEQYEDRKKLTGQQIFKQLLKFFPRDEFNLLVKKQQACGYTRLYIRGHNL